MSPQDHIYFNLCKSMDPKKLSILTQGIIWYNERQKWNSSQRFPVSKVMHFLFSCIFLRCYKHIGGGVPSVCIICFSILLKTQLFSIWRFWYLFFSSIRPLWEGLLIYTDTAWWTRPSQICCGSWFFQLSVLCLWACNIATGVSTFFLMNTGVVNMGLEHCSIAIRNNMWKCCC